MIDKLSLQNFRNYSKKTFEFSLGATLIVGPNAVGKTNILEAIYYLATGKSLRAKEEKEVIRESENVGAIRGFGEFGELEIIWDARTHFHKLYKVNGVGKRQVDFVGHLKAVLFQPTDLEIVIGSPSQRRHYLDNVLSQTHKDYRLASHLYEKGLRQRNRILWRAKREQLAVSSPLRREASEQLGYWNELLIENGRVIQKYRVQYLKFVNDHTDNFFALEVDYDHSLISKERLVRYRQEEALAGTTLVGPHRDDVIIKFPTSPRLRGASKFTRELARFGSRGEQRLGVFTLKIAEVDYVERESGERPILLLDDIFSELDADNRHHVFEFISRQQTIMTTTDVRKEEEKFLSQINAVEIKLK